MPSTCASLVSGALSEIAALGNQDTHLYCSPEETLWAQAYSRITNFAMAEQDVTFNNGPTASSWNETACVSAEIQRSGDLLCDLYVNARVSALVQEAAVGADPTYRLWTPALGFAMIKKARLQIGSQQIEELTDTYMMMHNEIHRAEGKQQKKQIGDYGRYLRAVRAEAQGAGAGEALVGADEDTLAAGVEFSSRIQELNVQLPYHFADHPGNALNVVGLQYHQIQVDLDIRGRTQLASEITVTSATGTLAKAALTSGDFAAGEGEISDFKLRAVFVHLDTAERRVRAQQPVTMMFVYPQNQEMAFSSTGGSVQEFRNYHNHPVVDLLWAYRGADKTRATVGGDGICEYFNFGAYSGAKVPAGTIEHYPQEVFDAIDSVELKLNNHSRICGNSAYFSQAVPRARSARTPDRVISQYSFAYNPSDLSRPTGSLNLSRIDNTVFSITLRTAGATREQIGQLTYSPQAQVTVAGTLEGSIFLHARTINFYRQAGGMLGLMFAN